MLKLENIFNIYFLKIISDTVNYAEFNTFEIEINRIRTYVFFLKKKELKFKIPS